MQRKNKYSVPRCYDFVPPQNQEIKRKNEDKPSSRPISDPEHIKEMIMTKIERQDFEQAIIGACLQENGYCVVAGVLTSRNFTTTTPFNHRLIFKAIQDLYPCRPIDLFTVAHEIAKPDYAWYLASCSARVVSAANLRHHAFILLQMSMRDSLIEFLNNAPDRFNLSTTTRSAINDIIDECLDSSNDILEVYAKAPVYLQGIGADESLIKATNDLCSGVQKKAQVIKSYSHLDSLMRNLDLICKNGYDAKSKFFINQLTELTKLIVAGQAIPDDALEMLGKLQDRIQNAHKEQSLTITRF